MEEYITLYELYIHDSSLFKNNNLKGFIKTANIEPCDIIKLKNNKIGIKASWVQQKIPSFNINLLHYDENKHKLKYFKSNIDGNFDAYFDAKKVLEKYGCKTFNPIKFNLNASHIKYFIKDDERKPYFTWKGLFKIKVFYNDLSDEIFEWIFELEYGVFKPQLNQLYNIKEMVTANHIPVIKIVDNKMIQLKHIYDIDINDIIIDFKKIGTFKKEFNKLQNENIESFKCPLYLQIQKNFQSSLKEAEKNFEIKLKELNQEKVIQYYKQELQKEKSLKDQMVLLTQSFIPNLNDEIQPFLSEKKSSLHSSSEKVILKPSKIK